MIYFTAERCDIEERALLGKECASDAEIDQYMATNYISIATLVGEPNLAVVSDDINSDEGKIGEHFRDLIYDIKPLYLKDIITI